MDDVATAGDVRTCPAVTQTHMRAKRSVARSCKYILSDFPCRCLGLQLRRPVMLQGHVSLHMLDCIQVCPSSEVYDFAPGRVYVTLQALSCGFWKQDKVSRSELGAIALRAKVSLSNLAGLNSAAAWSLPDCWVPRSPSFTTLSSLSQAEDF